MSRLVQTNVSTTDKLSFGKYKDKTVAYLLNADPKYLKWLKSTGIVHFNDYINQFL